MVYRYFNPNPEHNSANDCVVRMICKVFNFDWDTSYDLLWAEGRQVHEIPTTNWVWERILIDAGFNKEILHCEKSCLTIAEFTDYIRYGLFVVCTNSHVVYVKDGIYYDAWDSGDERIEYYYRR